jgi:hypothetical protein
MKKEKREKVVPTQEQLNKMVMDYLKASEKHIFQVNYVWEKENKDNLFKVFLKVLNEKIYRVEIQMKSGKVDLRVKEVNVSTKNELGMIKNYIFPQNCKHKSIKPSLEVKIKMDIVKKFIESSEDIETLKSEIIKVLK